MSVVSVFSDKANLSGQEELLALIAEGREPEIYQTQALKRPVKILRSFINDIPQLDLERAIYFTRSMKETEGEPLPLRWAKALRNVVENIPIYIAEDQLLAGQAGGPGRHGIVYPEIDGPHMEGVFRRAKMPERAVFKLTEEDRKRGDEELVDYWKDRGFLSKFYKGLPEDIRPIVFDENHEARFIIVENGSYVSCINWVPDYSKALNFGMKEIRRQAQEKLDALDPHNAKDMVEKKPFYQSIIMTCDNMKLFAERHAELAEKMAAETEDPGRRAELLQIAEHCRHVPENPARTFWEAVQSQWLVQLYSRLENKISCIVSQGRMDQYFYPFYKADIEKGLIDDERALEILNCLWASMARYTSVNVSELGAQSSEGYAHWENVTVGGQTREGADATNALSYLLLRCAREFPCNYPDLSARIHSMSPHRFLAECAETIKEGAGYP
ncbi:MAG: glycyl radical protein, partial [Desulfovibrio sp.]|nr:glycyl radical protein [Desulfovibrio sp.]